MSEIVAALNIVRDRLLLACAALERGDDATASVEIERAAAQLRATIKEVRARG